MQFTQRAVRVSIALAALVLGVVLACIPLGALSAGAHDQLVSSTPESGQTLSEAPAEATLEFSGEVAELGSEVALLREGEDVELSGELKFEGTKVTVPLPELEPGAYELNWRVVSSDGHPIAGTVPFIIGEQGGYEGIMNEPQDPNDFEGEIPSAQQGDESENNPWLMIGLGIVGLAVIGAAAVLLVKRFQNGNSPVRPEYGRTTTAKSKEQNGGSSAVDRDVADPDAQLDDDTPTTDTDRDV